MTFEELRDVIAEQFSCDVSEVTLATSLEGLGADNEDMIELAWQVGEAIGTTVDEQELENCVTVGELWHFISDLQEEALD